MSKVIYTHSVVVTQGQDIVHFVGYPGEPTKYDLDSLIEELETDFGLSNVQFHPGFDDLTDWMNQISQETNI